MLIMGCRFVSRIRKIFTITIILSLFSIFYGCSQDNFEAIKSDREMVAELILDGEYKISDDSIVKLPQEFADLADTGEVCMVLFENEPAVYFWTYRGMLGSSKGYIYLLNSSDKDIIDKCTDRFNFVSSSQIDDRWYSVSTDD